MLLRHTHTRALAAMQTPCRCWPWRVLCGFISTRGDLFPVDLVLAAAGRIQGALTSPPGEEPDAT